ncbi:uncharacterized protein LOC120338429 [Styela clava]
MKNVTNGTETGLLSESHKRNWIITESVFSLCLLPSIWITISLIHYGLKHKKFFCMMRTNQKNGSIYTLIFFVIATSIPRSAALQTIIASFVYETNDLVCNIGLFSFKGLYNINQFGVYSLLWWRQWLLYNQPIYKELIQGWFRKLQYISICLIFLSNAVGLIHHIAPISTKASQLGCKEMVNVKLGQILHLGKLVVTVISHTVLVLLFSYPIYKQIQTNRSIRKCSVPMESISKSVVSRQITGDSPSTVAVEKTEELGGKNKEVVQARKNQPRRSLTAVLIRSTVLSVFCALSDIAAFAIIFGIRKLFRNALLGIHVYLTVFEINACLNQMSIFLILSDWESILQTFWT